MHSLKTSSVDANGINFHFVEAGEGPLVLCMHGFPDHAYSFRYLIPDLARAGFRAVAPFMRGYSPTSTPKDGRYDAWLLSYDVLALIDALGAREATVVGHDFGGPAALGATILRPDKATRLVTIATSHPAVAESRDFNYLRGTWHAFYFQMPFAEETVAHDDFAFIEAWWRDASPKWDIPQEILEDVKETFRKPGVLEAAIAYYRQNAKHSLAPDLSDPTVEDTRRVISTSLVTVPTLAMHGTHDRPRRLEVFENMDRYFIGGLKKVVVPGTGHFMHQEKPDEVNQHIVDFLKS